MYQELRSFTHRCILFGYYESESRIVVVLRADDRREGPATDGEVTSGAFSRINAYAFFGASLTRERSFKRCRCFVDSSSDITIAPAT